MRITEREAVFPVSDYDLAATLTSGQAFRWNQRGAAWEGVIGRYWVALRSGKDSIIAETAEPVANWEWLTHYLQIHVGLGAVLASFPRDDSMNSAVAACHGL